MLMNEPETYRTMRQTVYNRYQACCTTCGSLDYFQKKKDAINCAEKHSCKKTSVSDLMAQKGKEPIVWERICEQIMDLVQNFGAATPICEMPKAQLETGDMRDGHSWGGDVQSERI